MDTNRLHQFKILVETHNLRKAADLLHITHAGLSKAMRTLEYELGIKLTSRDGRNIRITSDGMRLYKLLPTLLDAERLLLSKVASSQDVGSPLLRIGTFEVFSTYLAPMLTEVLPNNTRVDFRELIPGEVERALLREDIDLGLSYLAIPHADIDHLEVGHIEMAVYSAKGAFKGREFADLPFAVPLQPIEGTPTRATGLDGWPDDKIKRNIRYRVQLMETALALTRARQAVVYLPKFIARLHNETAAAGYHLEERAIPQKVNARQPIYLIKRRAEAESLFAKKIATCLRKL